MWRTLLSLMSYWRTFALSADWCSEHSPGRLDKPVWIAKVIPSKQGLLDFPLEIWAFISLPPIPTWTCSWMPSQVRNGTSVFPRNLVWHYSSCFSSLQQFAGGLNELWRRKNMKLVPRNLREKKNINTIHVLSWTYNVSEGLIFIFIPFLAHFQCFL